MIDADGLWLIAHEPQLLKGYPGAILTPNAIEFARLQAGVTGASISDATPSRIPSQHSQVVDLAADLGGGKVGKIDGVPQCRIHIYIYLLAYLSDESDEK